MPAASAGGIAASLLAADGTGAVIAGFAHSFYVRLGEGGYVCVGAKTIGAGPLNVLLEPTDWESLHAVAPGRVASAVGGALLLAGLQVDLAQAAVWRPRALALPDDALCMRLADLAARARSIAPAHGLARLAFLPAAERSADCLLQSAQPGWNALGSWLAGAIDASAAAAEPASATGALLGLGPGLTPSGDDVFAGVLIALRSLGEDAVAQALWSWLAPRLEAGTSALSAAHLRAAAGGQGHESVHALLAWLLEGAPDRCAPPARGQMIGAAADRRAEDGADALAGILRALARVGHCSGWDALAGAMLACRCWIDQRPASRAASSAACALVGATATPARSSVRHCSE